MRVFRAKDNTTFLDDKDFVDTLLISFNDFMDEVFSQSTPTPTTTPTQEPKRRLYMRAPIFEGVKDDIEWPLEFTQPQQPESQESSDWLFDFLDEDILQSLSNDNKDPPTTPSPPPPTTTTTSHEPSSTPKGFNNQISGIWLGSKGIPIPHSL